MNLRQRLYLLRHDIFVHHVERWRWKLLTLLPTRFVYHVFMEGTLRAIRDDEIVPNVPAVECMRRLDMRETRAR